MKTNQARRIEAEEIRKYQTKTYNELLGLIKNADTYTVSSPDGVEYYIEVHALWDDKPGGNLRILVEIDDRSMWRSMFPLTESFIKSADENIVKH